MTTSPADPINVLHVDDQGELLDVAATLLEGQNERIDVETETDPRSALQELDRRPIDCIVSDYEMPEMDGLELLDSVRDDHPDLPFILFTGKGSETVASEAISAGVTDYMQKGTGTDQYAVLANRIENSVRQHTAVEAAERAKRRLKELSESTSDCLWMFDRDWEELLFISGYEDVWGRPESAIRDDPQDFVKGVHPDARELVEDAMHRLTSGKPVNIEYRIVNGDGETGWVWAKGEPVVDDDGQVVRVVGFTRDITGRKRDEREVEDRNVVLQTVVNNLTEGIIVEDETREVFLANDAFGEVLDLPMAGEDLVGRNRAAAAAAIKEQFTAPNEFVAGIEETVAERTRVENEELELADGRILARDYVPYSSPDGQSNLWIYRDVTRYKERERELEFQSTILETFPEGIFVLDSEGVILDMYGSVESMTGFPRSELQKTPFQKLVDAGVFSQRAIEKYLDAVEHLLNSGDDVVVYEVDTNPAGGASRRLEVRLTVVSNDAFEGTIGVARDVTQRTERESELKRLHEETSFALDATNSLIWTIDLESGELENVRGPVESVFDLTSEDTSDVKTFIETSVHPEDRERFEQQYSSLVAGERESANITFRAGKTESEGRWIEVSGYIQNRNGSRSVVGLATDITAQKRRELDLKRQNERLEDFAAVVSHDLRNPLTVAHGQLELARSQCDSGHLQKVETALDRMANLVDDLLVLAQEGERVQETEAVQLGTAVDGCWQNVATGEASLTSKTNRTIRADPGRLRQLLENLFRNAIDHGGDDVSITVGELPNGFYVADDGPGIPHPEREEVFEMGHSSSKTGSGFGLAIVEDVVHAHGWNVTITDSDVGGARFEITGLGPV